MFRRSSPGPALRTVTCYHCGRAIQVAALAQTLTCPCCYQRLRVDDVLIDSPTCLPELRTAGTIVIARRGSLRTGQVEAGKGLTVLGQLIGHSARSPQVSLGPKSTWQGDCAANALDLHPTAVILGGRFAIGPSAFAPHPSTGGPAGQILPMHSA
jgi:hypothetical protein